MSCVATAPTFRLLDAHVGWDPAAIAAASRGLTGLDDPAGLRLAAAAGAEEGLPPGALDPRLPPPPLAYDCASCTWFLATPVPPRTPRLLRLGPCDEAWRSLPLDPSRRPQSIRALAAHRHLLAAAEREPGTGDGRIWVWRRRGGLVAVFPAGRVLALAFASACELLAAVAGAGRLRRHDPAGAFLGPHPARLPSPADHLPRRLAVAADGGVWLATRRRGGGAGGRLDLWHAPCGAGRFEPGDPERLAEALPDNGLTAVGEEGFCLGRPAGEPSGCARRCFSWYGRPLPESPLPLPPPPSPFATQGQLLTGPIDSGVPRCRWHRVRVEADVPEGTALALAVATSEVPDPPAQGVPDAAWAAFPAGLPHPADWTPAGGPPADGQQPAGGRDFLVDQPPGRYLFVRLRLTGDGAATPRVRRVRLDFPRVTSLERLPAVYRRDARSEDFSERFLALFDAAFEELDRAVERLPALLDPDGVPDEVLPWLGSFLDAVFDPAWETPRRRRILAALPALFPRRGTPAGLAEAVRLVFDVVPAIEELGAGEVWGAVARGGTAPSPLGARLGGVRLFGRSRSRFRVGRSALGEAPLRSYGDASLDAVAAGAHRIRVHLPAGAVAGEAARQRLARLVDSQKPAHTVALLRFGAASLVVGGELAVGIDTHLAAPAPPVLGSTARLRRDAVLRGGSGTAHPAPAVGLTAGAGAC